MRFYVGEIYYNYFINYNNIIIKILFDEMTTRSEASAKKIGNSEFRAAWCYSGQDARVIRPRNVSPKTLRFQFLGLISLPMISITSAQKCVSRILTLRRPLRHSWRIWVFYGSHGSGLTAIPKRSNNIPHKSTIADFLKYFIFW